MKTANPLILLGRPEGGLNPCCRRERPMIGFMGNKTWFDKKLKIFRL